jgi:hypothetical protein
MSLHLLLIQRLTFVSYPLPPGVANVYFTKTSIQSLSIMQLETNIAVAETKGSKPQTP